MFIVFLLFLFVLGLKVCTAALIPFHFFLPLLVPFLVFLSLPRPVLLALSVMDKSTFLLVDKQALAAAWASLLNPSPQNSSDL